MSYATTADYAEWARVQPPEDVDRLLERAAELLNSLITVRIDLDDDEHVVALRKASCAIVEYWLQTGEDSHIAGRGVKSYAIGSVRVEYDKAAGGADMSDLPERAVRVLRTAGLLYKGVGIR